MFARLVCSLAAQAKHTFESTGECPTCHGKDRRGTGTDTSLLGQQVLTDWPVARIYPRFLRLIGPSRE
eukprot:652318-Prorocentrum_minimum.AAC.1